MINSYSTGVAWSLAVESVGVDIRFHDLRHTCASLLIQAGATPVEVQRILEHSTPATTLNLYTHLLPDALDGAAARLDDYLGAEAVVAKLVAKPPTNVARRSTMKTGLWRCDQPLCGSGPRGTRTHNLRIKSPQLYH